MYFNNLIGRPTYEKEHLNLGKTGDSHKTNPSQLRRVSSPAPTARENTWQTNETNHAYVGVKRAAGNRLTYEKRAARLQKTSHSYKTNHPGTGNNGGLGGLMEDPISIQIPTFFAYMPRMTNDKAQNPNEKRREFAPATMAAFSAQDSSEPRYLKIFTVVAAVVPLGSGRVCSGYTRL